MQLGILQSGIIDSIGQRRQRSDVPVEVSFSEQSGRAAVERARLRDLIALGNMLVWEHLRGPSHDYHNKYLFLQAALYGQNPFEHNSTYVLCLPCTCTCRRCSQA